MIDHRGLSIFSYIGSVQGNILFVLYNDFASNSATQVHSLANELCALGYDCAVAVPSNKTSLASLGSAKFQALEFDDLGETVSIFFDGRGPDIVHAWTPRELVREFCERLRVRCPFKLFVQMEDNECYLLERILGKPRHELESLSRQELDTLVPKAWSHPHYFPEFLESAHGVTVIIDRLKELVPSSTPILELWPAAAETFRPQPKRPEHRLTFGIPINSTVVVYTGNVHCANAHEMRSLYLSVAILNREGHPTTLVRAGRDYYPFLGPDETWARSHSIELGAIPHTQIPDILALADILVQPGQVDEFNEFRFPSKLPEFLSVGRPVILPKCNIAHHMVHGEHAFILPESNALILADAIKKVMGDQALYRRLCEGALCFSRDNLSWRKSAKLLSDFYAACN